MLTAPPDASTFSFVLRKKHLSLDSGVITFAAYNESVESRAIEIGGVQAHTIFLADEPSFQLARKMGWEDVTEEFRAQAKVIDERTSTENDVLAVLTDEPVAFDDILFRAADAMDKLPSGATVTIRGREHLQETLDILEQAGRVISVLQDGVRHYARA